MTEEIPKIKFSNEIPEVYPKLKDRFGVFWEKENLIICYGDTLHCRVEIPPEKIVHEVEHVRRQKVYGKELWWDRYLVDDAFRLYEEILAYRKEYQFIVRNIKDRNARFNFLYEMARNLSGETYGSIISFSEALKEIQEK